MKKYLKLLGRLLFYYAFPIVMVFAAIKVFNSVEALKGLFKYAPIVFFGLSDPLIIISFFIFFKLVKKQNLFTYCNFSNPGAGKLLLFILFGITMGTFTYSLANIDFVKSNFNALTVSVTQFLVIGNIVALVILVPINSTFKEIAYRGLMFNEIRENVNFAVAFIVQALAYASFVFIEGGWILATYAFLGSLVFGLIYYFGKTLWASIIAEVLCTLSMVFINRNIPASVFSNNGSIAIFLLSIIVLIVLFFVLYRTMNVGTGKNKKSAPSAL